MRFSSSCPGGAVALLAVLLAVPAAGRADAIGPPPTDCPAGSTAVDFCHGPATCRTATCEDDADCGSGMTCSEQALCTREHCCSGRCCAIDCGEPPTTYTHVEGPCSAGDTCDAVGTTCNKIKVCVPASSDAGTATDAGGGDMDAGGDDTDAGGGGTDAGGTDGGEGGMDAGDGVDAGGGTDAGPGRGTDDGGCCAVLGGRGQARLALLAVALLGLAVWLRRGRR